MVRLAHLAGPHVFVLAITVLACSSPPPSPTPASSAALSSVGAGSPPLLAGDSSQSLITADLASGAIDLATSLELRAWALFGDPRLPERYDGTGSAGEDGALFEDIATNLASLPAERQTELSRYLLRPTDPHSPLSDPTVPSATTSAFIAANFVAADDPSTTQECGEGKHWFFRDWTPSGGA